ncbi:glutathione S-transferase family protein [alpha proteobacterium U9-1i]|nr:glutathione S-transferase family protein [alpha proteobacterium U9-1i]
MQLQFSPVSPFARKFRVIVREKGLLGRVEEAPRIVTRDGAPADPLAQPPILAVDDDKGFMDPFEILQALDEMGAGPKLLPTKEADRTAALRLFVLADGALEAGVQIRNALPQQPSPDRDYWIDRWQKAILSGIYAAEQASPKAVPLNAGAIAMVCTLSWIDAALPGAQWRDTHPKLAALQRALEALPSFQDVGMA